MSCVGTETSVGRVQILMMGFIVGIALAACSGGTTLDGELERDRVLLHLDYRSGGDAPLSFIMTFLDDGRVRYYSPHRKVHWAHLDREDRRRLEEIVVSPRLRDDLTNTQSPGNSFACCDRREVGVFFGADVSPVVIDFEETFDAPETVRDLVSWVNRMGRQYFGGRYRMELPEL